MLFKIYLDKFDPEVMATVRFAGMGDDTIEVYMVATSGSKILGESRTPSSKKAHSGKKNGGPFYCWGTWHDFHIPEGARNVSFAVIVLNSATRVSDNVLKQLAARLEQGLPVVMPNAGPDAHLQPIRDGLRLLPANGYGPIGDIANGIVDTVFNNKDAVVFYDRVTIVDPGHVAVAEHLPFDKTMALGERARYRVIYQILRVD